MTAYDKATIEELYRGTLPWPQLKQMMSAFKDAERFDTFIAVLQEQVPWDDQVLLPLGPKLFVVLKDDGSIVTKSMSGYEFGDYRKNWKLKARIAVRDSDEKMQEIYPKWMHADPAWMELREYYDPLDGSLLEVEAVPPGYPIVHSFEPDLEGFYTEWLGREFPPKRA